MDRTKFLIQAHKSVKSSGHFNFQGEKIVLPSKFNFSFLEDRLKNYSDKQVIDLLKYGFPVDSKLLEQDPGIPDNHKGAKEF